MQPCCLETKRFSGFVFMDKNPLYYLNRAMMYFILNMVDTTPLADFLTEYHPADTSIRKTKSQKARVE